MSISRFAVLTCILASAVVFAGCQGRGYQQVTIDGSPTGAPLALNLSNPAGSIYVFASDSVSKPTVTARYEAASGIGRRIRMQHKEDTEILAHVTAEEGGETLSVRVNAPNPDAVGVRLMVRVPKAHGVRVDSARHNVTLFGVGGPMAIHVADADINLRTDQHLREPIEIESESGRIRLDLYGGASGHFVVESARDVVFNARDEKVSGVTAGRTRHEAVVGGGVSPVRLRSGSKSVEVVFHERK